MTSLNERNNQHTNTIHYICRENAANAFSLHIPFLLNLVILATRVTFIYNFAKITNLPKFV